MPPQVRQESRHVPVGQLDVLEEELPDFAANVEKTFFVAFEPHFSQAWAFRLSGFSRNAVTCPHFLQRYSKIGMASLLAVLTEELLSPPAPIAPGVIEPVPGVSARLRRRFELIERRPGLCLAPAQKPYPALPVSLKHLPLPLFPRVP